MNIKPDIIEDIDKDWLQSTASKITSGQTTLKKECKNAKFIIKNSLSIIYPISENSLRRAFRFYNIDYSAKKGPAEKEIPIDITFNVIKYYLLLKCGETVTYHSMKAANEDVTLYQVRKVFQENNLYKYKKPQDEKPKTRCTYQAKYVNQIWHADIHYLEKNKLYLYSIIDDRSRFIVGYEVIVEKSADQCKRILENAIQTYGKPAIMWTDNGGENTADKMMGFLKTNRIYPVFITPGNPQQNGKIEAFWPKLDDFISDESEIANYIYVYNNLKAHTCLEKGTNGCFKRPVDVFFDESLQWKREYPWKWYVNGKEVDFKINEERKKEYYD